MTVGSADLDQFRPRLAYRRLVSALFAGLCGAAMLLSVLVLAILLGRVVQEGLPVISRGFLTRFASVLTPEKSGVAAALWGSLWVMVLTGLVSVPLGTGAAVYLQEYARPSRAKRWVELNIANLAGVPSIVYGLLGLAVFVRLLQLKHSVLAGSLTLSLMVLPVIIIATQEALLAVPNSVREAAYALGATRWQTIWHHVLPAALPGVLTGTILGLSRAIGEAAPLIVIGAATYISFVPRHPMDEFTVLPLQIYHWAEQPQPEYHRLSAGAILVLLVVLFGLNSISVALRAWQQRRQVV